MLDALPWDPEMESPATIAIIGAGPLGIEAALYAKFLGYHVSIFESRRVAHRMLNWHDRPLGLPVNSVTTSLGLAALQAHDPDYQKPDPQRIFTGKEYAQEYLLPLAKTDLLFDDIHFLSPVVDVSRFRSRELPEYQKYDQFDWQQRCNDEFRILVHGRHRGPWTSRADCIIDCRGLGPSRCGLGPAGGLAIGESNASQDFLEHMPEDRKFEPKAYDNKRILIVGHNQDALRTISECLRYAKHKQLIWVLPPASSQDSPSLAQSRNDLSMQTSQEFVMIESLGIESIARDEQGTWQIRLLKDDESTVEIQSDHLVSRTEYLYEPLGRTLLAEEPKASCYLDSILPEREPSDPSDFQTDRRYRQVITPEPGYFKLDSQGGLSEGFQRLRTIFAILGGRVDLDLYQIMKAQNQ
jgi:hypothetical protein